MPIKAAPVQAHPTGRMGPTCVLSSLHWALQTAVVPGCSHCKMSNEEGKERLGELSVFVRYICIKQLGWVILNRISASTFLGLSQASSEVALVERSWLCLRSRPLGGQPTCNDVIIAECNVWTSAAWLRRSWQGFLSWKRSPSQLSTILRVLPPCAPWWLIQASWVTSNSYPHYAT